MHPDLAKLVVLQDPRHRGKTSARSRSPRCHARSPRSKLKAAATEGQRAVVLDLIARKRPCAAARSPSIADQRQKLARTQKKIDLPPPPSRSPRWSTRPPSPAPRSTAWKTPNWRAWSAPKLSRRSRPSPTGRRRDRPQLSGARPHRRTPRHRPRRTRRVDAKRAALRAEIAQSPTGEDSLSIYDRISPLQGQPPSPRPSTRSAPHAR